MNDRLDSKMEIIIVEKKETLKEFDLSVPTEVKIEI